MKHLPLTSVPPEGDTPINAKCVAFACVNSKTRKEAITMLSANIMLNRLVQNHYRKEPQNGPRKNNPHRKTLSIPKRGTSKDGEGT